MTKLKIAVVAVVIVGIVTPPVLLRRANEALRQAQENLAERDRKLEELRKENQRLIVQRQQPLSGEQIAELMRLRREVARLKKANGELAPPKGTTGQAVSAANRNAPQSSAWTVGQFVPKEQWLDAGFEKPEATVQTMYWAMATGNGQRYLDALLKPDGESFPNDVELQKVMTSITQSFKSAQGLTLDASESISEDEVKLRVTVKKLSGEAPEGVTSAQELLVLQRRGTEWKIVPGTPPLLTAPASDSSVLPPTEVEGPNEE